MTLDKMLFSRLNGDAELARLLVPFGDRPAVFYQRAQPSSHPKWGDRQYPRIDYIVDYQENPARQTSGRLTLNIWCDVNDGAEPEIIEERIRELLHASFAKTDDYPYCLSWISSDAFEVTGDVELRTIGITMAFDLIAFPPQYTMRPDPVKGLSEWAKAILPNAVVIGVDELPDWFTPTREKPVIYWRLASMGIYEQHHVVTWMNVTLEGHVYALTADDRLVNLIKLNTEAALCHHVTLEDTSPLFIREFTPRPHLNFLSPGQILLRGRFGILQPSYANPPDVPPLDHANMRQKDKE